MKHDSIILAVSGAVGTVILIIIIKLVYHLAWGVFVPVASIYLGFLVLAFIWCRERRRKRSIKTPLSSQPSDLEFGYSAVQEAPAEIDNNGMSVLHNGRREVGGVVRTEVDGTPIVELAQVNKTTSPPHCEVVSNRTTISTTFGAYGDFDLPPPVAMPTQDTHWHAQKRANFSRPHKLTLFPTPTIPQLKAPALERPLPSTPRDSNCSSFIIELYAGHEPELGTSPEKSTLDDDRNIVRTGTPF